MSAAGEEAQVSTHPSRIGKAAGKAVAGASTAAKAASRRINQGWDDYPEESGGKGGQVLYGCGDGVPKDATYINRLKSDLANSYYWTGGFCQDYFFFVANWHPLVGIFACHPNHPWSKFERLEMFLISLAITMVPSAAIGAHFRNDGDSMFRMRTPLIIAFVTVPDIVFGVILYQLAIADSRCPNLCGCCLDLIKKCTIVWVAIFALAATGISYFILNSAKVSWAALFVPLCEGRLISFLTWFPVWLILPCQLGYLSLWCSERKAAEKAAAASEQGAKAGADAADRA